MRLCCGMVEKNSGLTAQSFHFESVLHQQENVRVSRLSLGTDERTENNEAR
jgi:hypothetical protein